MNEIHNPVLLKESLSYLITDHSGKYFDGTLGFGGHSGKIIDSLNKDGILVSTDVDEKAFQYSSEKFKDEERIKLYKFNFSQIEIISKIESIDKFDGIFADLGVSSFQLDDAHAGFTYREETDLDLRMDKTRKVTAADILNSFEEKKIADILYKYGEEKNSRSIARHIGRVRTVKKIKTTKDLVDIINPITPKIYQTKTLSRVFQALRIYINDELNVLQSFLEKSISLLKTGGRIVIISYHSLEDRIVKDIFKYETLDCICPKESPVCVCSKEARLKILTKKPVVPTDDEIKNNFRSRSAKLRAAERV